MRREFVFTINPEAQEKLERHLQLKAPVRVHISRDRTGHLHGDYNRQARLITIYPGVKLLEGSRLLHVKRELIETVLHEFRHAHQWDNWPAEKLARDLLRPYPLREREKDADDFAQRNVAQWLILGEVRVKKSPSPLRRLSKAERSLA